MDNVSKVRFKIKRYKEGKSWWQNYEVEVDRFTSVVQVLRYIKENLDPTLSFRASCHMAVCGSCGMKIQGKPKLACKTLVLHEINKNNEITIEPLDMKVIKDLIVDMTDFYDKMEKIDPRIRPHEEVLKGNYEQRLKPEDQRELWQFAQCIWCGLCYSACPITRSNKNFLGPAALAKAYVFIADPRDTEKEKRIKVINSLDGIWDCRVAGSCSIVCPRNVDPSLAIQKLKAMVI
ncbi:succinate dehydrogenase/fumarate reductase iron-sulfur subunit [Acidianus manzaensis]|uniref:succinate dehydrogenase n=1 Tax=Acidianus manzaensis TaxID=282676 RepID=A0A1W6JYD0_9CREN|nr:succinate dehydrogenase/fumarate reductase iron-sulfur subunit [Acidianus manzaensis]ARM75321.1 hypothetical protein B6F84_04255 [Acidianus manzaensis]